MRPVLYLGRPPAEPAGTEETGPAERVSVVWAKSPGSARSTAADGLYSQSPAMGDVLALIARAATMRGGVTIRGEDGTGRRIVARAIHEKLAPRSKGPFVPVDCAASDAEQLDVELFGVGSRSRHGDPARGFVRVGRQSRLFEARNGTLYLQHLADASTRVQARLARILRDREAILTESGETIALDIRPVAGVDASFDAAVQEGRVREDLARRLSAIRIDMPPLRSRREDTPALANCFLRDICRSLRIPPKTLSRSALSLVAALPWRGNAVELRALLESAVAGVRGGRAIGLDEVLAHLRLDGSSVGYSTDATLRQARVRFEREYISAALERHHGRISEAARALGIQRTNLYRKLRSLRVTRERRG